MVSVQRAVSFFFGGGNSNALIVVGWMIHMLRVPVYAACIESSLIHFVIVRWPGKKERTARRPRASSPRDCQLSNIQNLYRMKSPNMQHNTAVHAGSKAFVRSTN